MVSPVNVMFVSEQCALRAPMAEACLRQLGKGRFEAFSCGVPGKVAPAVTPIALDVLARNGLPTDSLQPKDWTPFLQAGSPRMDFVISLDEGILSHHPVWPAQPEQALWGYAPLNPAVATYEHKVQYALNILVSLRRRVDLLVNLYAKVKHRSELRDDLRDLGYT